MAVSACAGCPRSVHVGWREDSALHAEVGRWERGFRERTEDGGRGLARIDRLAYRSGREALHYAGNGANSCAVFLLPRSKAPERQMILTGLHSAELLVIPSFWASCTPPYPDDVRVLHAETAAVDLTSTMIASLKSRNRLFHVRVFPYCKQLHDHMDYIMSVTHNLAS